MVHRALPVAHGTTVQSALPAHHVRVRSALRWIVSGSAALLTVLTAGCAGSGGGDGGEDDTPVDTDVVLRSETAIFGGAPDDDRQGASSVVALKVTRGSGEFELCSAALIAPNVVLTARHCVARGVTETISCDENGNSTNGAHVAGNQDPSSVAVYLGAAPDFNASSSARGRAIVAPEGDTLCDRDIALVVLDRELDDVEPIAVRLHSGVTASDTIRSVGYGQNDKSMPIGTRIRKTGVSVLATGRGISKSKTALGLHEFEVGRSICQGDSGGPALSEDTGAVVGVVSRGGDCTNDFGHVYTTTTGWSDLFDRAFAIAGGAPIVESGRPIGTETGPSARPVTSAPIEEIETASQSCAASPARGSASSPVAALAVALSAALVRRRRK